MEHERPIEQREKIVLSNVEGISRKSGIDQFGNHWIEFEVDYPAQQEAGTCAICGKEIESGWLCLDGGDEICREHVAIK